LKRKAMPNEGNWRRFPKDRGNGREKFSHGVLFCRKKKVMNSFRKSDQKTLERKGEKKGQTPSNIQRGEADGHSLGACLKMSPVRKRPEGDRHREKGYVGGTGKVWMGPKKKTAHTD